ncbi:L-proline trans-4-hydroxylase-like [Amphiura filiformis]|uniref:L-proline trans-4-hydroxylase-like n=1 Tax=Amphiura filiformis TaxID=82378 RepID=UPI003B21EE4D
MKVTSEMKAMFDKHGLVVVRSLFDEEENTKLRQAAEHKDGLTNHSFLQADANDGDSGLRSIEMVLWNHPGDDVTGMMARVHKMATSMEIFMGCKEMYHWHSKLIMKHARSGGSHVWHQDYGYWYTGGVLYPDMGTVLVAIDKCTPENGCLEVLPGSHKCGRVDHINVGGQMTVDPKRLQLLKDHIKTYQVPLNPGDAIFTHANLVHWAPQNNSDTRRWCYGIAYSDVQNSPYNDKFHPVYTPLIKVDDDAVRKCENFTDFTGKDFYKRDYDSF